MQSDDEKSKLLKHAFVDIGNLFDHEIHILDVEKVGGDSIGRYFHIIEDRTGMVENNFIAIFLGVLSMIHTWSTNSYQPNGMIQK